MKKGWISLVMASSMMLALTACSGAASTPTAAATEAKTEEKKEELRDRIMDHINTPDIHVSLREKLFWNNKLNVNDQAEMVDGALIFNRN